MLRRRADGATYHEAVALALDELLGFLHFLPMAQSLLLESCRAILLVFQQVTRNELGEDSSAYCQLRSERLARLLL